MDNNSEPNNFDAWFVGGNDPKAAIVYPQHHFWVSVKIFSKWCGFLQLDNITNGIVLNSISTDTEEGMVNEEVSFNKTLFSVPCMVGYHHNQLLRITVYDGDQMRLRQGYCMASIQIPLCEITSSLSKFSLNRGDKQLGELFVHTELDKVTKVTKLFSPDPTMSLSFSDTSPNEAKLRKESEYFNEKMFFYLFKLNCPSLFEYDKKKLKSITGYSLYLRITKGDKDPISGETISSSKILWRSRSLDSPPFKLKAYGLTFSHDHLTGFTDTRTKPAETACLLFELMYVSKEGLEIPLCRCDVKLKDIVELSSEGKLTLQETFIPTLAVKAEREKLSGDSNGFEVEKVEYDGNEDDLIDEEFEVMGKDTAPVDDKLGEDVAKTRKGSYYSLPSFGGSRKMSMLSLFSDAKSTKDSSIQESFVMLIKKFGKIQIKVKKQVTLQKVASGNEMYEDRLHAIVEQIRSRWLRRMIDVFEQAVLRRRLEAVRYYHFLKRINQGWSLNGFIVADLYHPCLQNIVGQMNQKFGKVKKVMSTSANSCRVLSATCLLFSTMKPFLRNEEIVAIAGGCISLPSPKFSRFIDIDEDTSHEKKMEAIDGYFVRNIGFPIAQEYLSCQGASEVNEFLFSFQLLKTLSKWFTTADNADTAAINDSSVTEASRQSIFATPDFCDPLRAIREWANKVSNDPLYAKKISYKDSTQLVQGFMEASGIYFPAHSMADNLYSKKSKNDVPQSITQLNQFRRNETRRIACYTGTDYDIDLNSSQITFLNDLPKTSVLGKKERSFDLDTLNYLLNQEAPEKELNIVTWVIGRSPPTSEQKKFRALMQQQRSRKKASSVLLIILAAEQRYDVNNTEKDMLTKIADPFADFLNWYHDSLQSVDPNKKDNESDSASVIEAGLCSPFTIASNLGILPSKDVNAKVAVLHYISWAEVMAKAYQLDDVERQRLRLCSQEDQQKKNDITKNSKVGQQTLDEVDLDTSIEFADSQLPSILSLKEVLMRIFSVEVAEKIIGQKVEDWMPDEDTTHDERTSETGKSTASQHVNDDETGMSAMISHSLDFKSSDDRRSSTGKVNAQILAHMKQLMRGNDDYSDDGQSVASNIKIDRGASPHFAAKQEMITEIKSFHELNKIKVRFDEEIQNFMQRQIDDQLATFLLAFDYDDKEYVEYEGKLRPNF